VRRVGRHVQILEWALNASCGVVSALALERTLEEHFMPLIRKALRIRETREAMLAAALPSGDGSRSTLTPAAPLDHRLSPVLFAPAGGLGGRVAGQGVSAGCQTESSVTEERGVQRLLSPRHRHAEAPHLPPQAPRDAAREGGAGVSDAQRGVGAGSREKGGSETIELWYANRIFSLTVPRFDPSTLHLSGVADMVLNLPDNEDLLAAAIRHERKVPCTVARLQGSQLRPARPSNVDVPLMMALVHKFFEIENDYTKPMLRIDIADQQLGKMTEFYLPPLSKGKVHGTDVVEAAARRAGVSLLQEQVVAYARHLEEYSKLPPREELKRVDPRADPTKFRDPSYQSTEKIGFDLRIDLALGQMAVAVRRADMTFTVRQSDTEDLAKEILRRTRAELADVLAVPLNTLEVTFTLSLDRPLALAPTRPRP
jgi:hypothetical protein